MPQEQQQEQFTDRELADAVAADRSLRERPDGLNRADLAAEHGWFGRNGRPNRHRAWKAVQVLRKLRPDDPRAPRFPIIVGEDSRHRYARDFADYLTWLKDTQVPLVRRWLEMLASNTRHAARLNVRAERLARDFEYLIGKIEELQEDMALEQERALEQQPS